MVKFRDTDSHVPTSKFRLAKNDIEISGTIEAKKAAVSELDVTGSTPVAGHVPYASSISGDVATLGWASTHKTGMLHARGISKIGASGDLNLSGTNQIIFWAGTTSPTTSSDGASGNWVPSGVFSNGATANALFQVSVAGLYEVKATMTVKADTNEERYATLKLTAASATSDDALGLLLGIQVIKQADSSAASYTQVHCSGIVSLAASTDYCFVARSENDGTGLIYDFSGTNTLLIKPLL